MTTATPAVLWAGLVAFLGVLTAYVCLALAGVDTGGFINAIVTLAGLLGLGAHVERRTVQQNRQLDTITRQTNGVLDERIRNGSETAIRKLLREAGYTHIDADPK